MSRVATFTLFLALAFTAAPAAASCMYPLAPAFIPAGETATYEEMVEAHQMVKEFDEDVRTYTRCLELDARTILEDPTVSEARKQELRNTLADLNDAAVEHAELVVAAFNIQLRIFRERNAN